MFHKDDSTKPSKFLRSLRHYKGQVHVTCRHAHEDPNSEDPNDVATVRDQACIPGIVPNSDHIEHGPARMQGVVKTAIGNL